MLQYLHDLAHGNPAGFGMLCMFVFAIVGTAFIDGIDEKGEEE